MVITTIIFTIKLLISIFKQHFFVKQCLKSHIPQATDIKLKKKMYAYGTLVPSLFTYPYAKMAGQELTKSKKESATLLAALMAVNDEYVDDLGNDKNHIDHFYKQIASTQPKNTHEILQKSLYQQIIKLTDNDSQIKLDFDNIHQSQLDSLDQKHKISQSKLISITKNKGGDSAVIFCRLVNFTMKSQDVCVLQQIGYWVQLVDDMLDTVNDKNDGINTLATQINGPDFLHLLEQEREKTWMQVKKLPYSEKQKKDFLFSVYFFTEFGKAFFTHTDGLGSDKLTSGFLETLRSLTYLSYAWRNILQFQY